MSHVFLTILFYPQMYVIVLYNINLIDIVAQIMINVFNIIMIFHNLAVSHFVVL